MRTTYRLKHLSCGASSNETGIT